MPVDATNSVNGKPRVVALLGNPNTGKTTLFNALAGMRQRVGNYPGVTVETKKGQMTFRDTKFELIDLPGTYSLAPRSPDEMVTVDLILGQQNGEARPDVLLSIVDASNLERNLYLTTQALELGVPIVVALNMVDVAEAQGVRIDVDQLGKQLGLPVVPIQANKGKGLERLKQVIAETAASAEHVHGPAFPEAFEQEVAALHAIVGPGFSRFLARRILLDVGGFTEERLRSRTLQNSSNDHGGPPISLEALLKSARERLEIAGCGVPGIEARTRYAWIRKATDGCIHRPKQRPRTWTDRLDRVLTHKVWGSLIFLVLMFVVFQSIFEWARPLMKYIGTGKDMVAEWLRDGLPAGPLSSLLIDGVLEGVGTVVVFLPQIVILFGFIAILEDCGYMARAAFLMDKIMSRCGLSGKSFIPMLSSVACAVPGIMAARVIENRRDRLTTILVAPLMSCSARLPVYILLIGAFLPVRSHANPNGFAWWVPGLTMFAMYSIGMVVAPLVALLLKRTLLRGETPLFVMEMPMYKLPSLRTVIRRMVDSGWAFLYRAGTLIMASMIVVWALLYFPFVDAQGDRYEDRIAEMEQAIVGPKKLLSELENSIAQDKKLIEDLDEREAATEGIERDELRDQKQALEEKIAPVLELMKPFEALIDPVEEQINLLRGEWQSRSILGRLGHAIEPVVRPLGWDWKIGMAALASFPAREVVVGTLGIIYNQGKVDTEEIREAKKVANTKLAKAMIVASWEDEPTRKVFTVATALSLMVFFALCCQCASTLAVIRRETNSWRWPALTFVYMTVLAYIGAFVTYQVGSWIWGA